MDPSLFCEVTLDDNQTSSDKDLGNITEEDIVLVDNDYEDTSNKQGAKRPHGGSNTNTPPTKKSRRGPIPKVNNKMIQGTTFKAAKNPHSPLSQNSLNTLSPSTANLLKSKHLSVSTTKSPSKFSPSPKLKQSITWKYRQLPESQYTADIRKAELLKNYEAEQCNCQKAGEDSTACGSGCINRSTYSECDLEVCVNGKLCTNMVIQKRQYAPGLERFMTAKKGWGVRARQSVAKGSFILEYTGEICSSQEFERRMLNRYRGDNHHYCLAMDNKTMIDAHRAGSECRFVNHSCAPNCEMEKWNVAGLSRMALFALRDILPGEEICYDYNFSLFNTDQGQECKCGAKECRGVIGGRGKDYLITLDSEEPVQPKTPKQHKPAPHPRTAEDETWFSANLSSEELDWIVKNALKPGQLEAKTIKCTVCNECLNFKVQSSCQRHPDLGVVMCIKCRGLYGKGGWDKDPDGNDEFCRWCSEGGQIYLCDFCPHAFCNKCLRWNLGRKYLKKIEDEEKWKCLKCEPSFLKEQKALYWAIFKYHKDRPVKVRGTPSASLTPVRGVKALQQNVSVGKPRGLNSPRVRPQVIGVKSTIRPQLLNQKMAASPGSINTAYSKLQKNGAISVQSVHGVQSRLNGVRPVLNKKVVKEVPKHFVEFMLKDADDCIEQFVNMVGEVRKMWKLSTRKESDVTSVTKKLRKILDLAKHNIEEVDKKVLDSYRTNIEDADVRDVSPGDIICEKNKVRELEIFAKSKDIVDSDVENVETTPDLPFMDFDPSESGSDTEPIDSCEIVIDESSEEQDSTGNGDIESDTPVVDLDSEEGIHDMSVEELEVGEDESIEDADSDASESNKTEGPIKISKNCDISNDISDILGNVDPGENIEDENSLDIKIEKIENGSIIDSTDIENEVKREDEQLKDISDSEMDVKIESKEIDHTENETVEVNLQEIASEAKPCNLVGDRKPVDVNEVSELKEPKEISEREIDATNCRDGDAILERKKVENIEERKSIGIEKDIKDNKITIEYKNEASPIKDKKDFYKESKKCIRSNNGNYAADENKNGEAVKEVQTSVKDASTYIVTEKKRIEPLEQKKEDKNIMKLENVEVNLPLVQEQAKDNCKIPGVEFVDPKLSIQVNGLDSVSSCKDESLDAETDALESYKQGPQDSKSITSCHEASTIVLASEESVSQSEVTESGSIST